MKKKHRKINFRHKILNINITGFSSRWTDFKINEKIITFFKEIFLVNIIC